MSFRVLKVEKNSTTNLRNKVSSSELKESSSSSQSASRRKNIKSEASPLPVLYVSSSQGTPSPATSSAPSQVASGTSKENCNPPSSSIYETVKKTSTSPNQSAETTINEDIKRSFYKFRNQCSLLQFNTARKEFSELEEPQPNECQSYLDSHNATKNRYNNIFCLDSTRVVLHFGADKRSTNTYIHANRIDYSSLKCPFVITQGPLGKTVVDFWRLIWQECTRFIVQLCVCVEGGRKKSAEYFSTYPNRLNPMWYSMFKVITISRKIDRGLITTSLEIEHKGVKRDITHFQIVDWPDCRPPANNCKQLFRVFKYVRTSKTPVVVHCSAGIGRSGTFVAIEMIVNDILKGKTVKVIDVVRTLRRQRCQAVQTLDQYFAIHKCVLQYGHAYGHLRFKDVSQLYLKLDDFMTNCE